VCDCVTVNVTVSLIVANSATSDKSRQLSSLPFNHKQGEMKRDREEERKGEREKMKLGGM